MGALLFLLGKTTSEYIKQDTQGRYCLNDLHKASGGATKHQPNHFFALDSTKDLMLELRADWELSSRDSGTITPVERVIGKGKAQGTYVVRELVYAYAMWISASFQLKVIRRGLDINLMKI